MRKMCYYKSSETVKIYLTIPEEWLGETYFILSIVHINLLFHVLKNAAQNKL